MQGVTRNPIPGGGLTDFLAKSRLLFQLLIISICYTKNFNLLNSNISVRKLFRKICSFAYFLIIRNVAGVASYRKFRLLFVINSVNSTC
ncbi:hypothetical protein CWM66_23945 [Kosakonia sp. H7A]|nr:hypothetical protein AW40_10910 [Kosakonia radicincitans UMEnt01/12]PTA88041.1 hypothetical protein CWM66_23945 [Kosakonia sp. H7A]